MHPGFWAPSNFSISICWATDQPSGTTTARHARNPGSDPSGDIPPSPQARWQEHSISIRWATDQPSGTTIARDARSPGSIPPGDIPQSPDPTPNPTLPSRVEACAAYHVSTPAVTALNSRQFRHFRPHWGWVLTSTTWLPGFVSLRADVIGASVCGSMFSRAIVSWPLQWGPASCAAVTGVG